MGLHDGQAAVSEATMESASAKKAPCSGKHTRLLWAPGLATTVVLVGGTEAGVGEEE